MTQPSDVVVAQNFVRNDTAGTIQQVDAKYELLQRGQYVMNRGQYQPIRINPKGPLQLAEAENAVEIARMAGAERYAADTFQKALIDLQNAEGFLNRGGNRKESETNAREAAQMAEDARIITFRKIRDEELAKERADAAARQAQAQAAGPGAGPAVQKPPGRRSSAPRLTRIAKPPYRRKPKPSRWPRKPTAKRLKPTPPAPPLYPSSRPPMPPPPRPAWPPSRLIRDATRPKPRRLLSASASATS